MAVIGEVSYGELLAKTLPRVIETDAENGRMIAELEALDSLPEMTPEQASLAELMTVLIEQFEQRYDLGNANPLDALKSLMEDRGIRQRDLLPVFGSSSVASDVLSGKRAVSPNTSAASQPLHLTDSQGAKRALQPAESICPTGLLRSASTSEESD
jgi:HTH-type transcriptional regulator / antitoxin HigA